MAALSGTSGLASLFSKAAFAADSDIAGQSRRFDAPYCNPWRMTWQNPVGWRTASAAGNAGTMTPQAYNAIRYDEKQSLWNNIEGRQLDVQFFHMGMGFRRRVRMFSLDRLRLRRVRSTSVLSCSAITRRTSIPNSCKGRATSVLRASAFKAPELARRDIVSFLGRSYFRAVDDLPVRSFCPWSGGDTFTDTPEEFPDFTRSGLKP
jgi:glucan biosynthesis protein